VPSCVVPPVSANAVEVVREQSRSITCIQRARSHPRVAQQLPATAAPSSPECRSI